MCALNAGTAQAARRESTSSAHRNYLNRKKTYGRDEAAGGKFGA